jgi:hypothetical protein
MGIIFTVFSKAISQGNWLVIPAVILLINLCVSICIVIPYFLNRYVDLPIPARSAKDSPDDSLHSWLSGFQYEIVVLCRWGIIIAPTLWIFSGTILVSISTINWFAGARVFSLLFISSDYDNTLVLVIIGLILLAVGSYFILYFRSRAKGGEAFTDFMHRSKQFIINILMISNIAWYILILFRVITISFPEFLCSIGVSFCIPFFHVLFFSKGSLFGSRDAYNKPKRLFDRPFRFLRLPDPSGQDVVLDQGFAVEKDQEKPPEVSFRFAKLEDPPQEDSG